MKRLGMFLLPLLALVACQDMSEQPRMDTYEPAEPFEDNMEARHLPLGVVALGPEEEAAQPISFGLNFVQEGRRDFETYCSPCHGLSGRGDGIVVQRGFPRPPSFLIERLRKVPADHFFNVITDGYGVMYSYADRVPPEDRWQIIAYIRALQLAQPPAEEAEPVDVVGGRQ